MQHLTQTKETRNHVKSGQVSGVSEIAAGYMHQIHHHKSTMNKVNITSINVHATTIIM